MPGAVILCCCGELSRPAGAPCTVETHPTKAPRARRSSTPTVDVREGQGVVVFGPGERVASRSCGGSGRIQEGGCGSEAWHASGGVGAIFAGTRLKHTLAIACVDGVPGDEQHDSEAV